MLSVETHIIMHASLAVEVRLPLEAEIDVLGVMRGLHGDVDDAVLAGDRRRFDTAAFDCLVADVLLVSLVAGQTPFLCLTILEPLWARLVSQS